MLRMSALTGFGSGAGGGPIVIEGSVAGNVSTVDGTTHALGNIDVGAASGDKNAIILLTWSDATVFTITSLTVGGVALSQLKNIANNSGERITAAMWGADISSINGSQAISVTFSSAVESAAASGVALSGLKSFTSTDAQSTFGNNGSTATLNTLFTPPHGIILAVGGNADQSVTSSWSIMTERADVSTGGGDPDHRHTAAWDLGARTSADEVITWTGSGSFAAVGASFR